MHKHLLQLVLASTVVLVSSGAAFPHGDGALAPPRKTVISTATNPLTIPVRIAEGGEVQRIPLFSEEHANTAVAVVNGEPITLGTLAMELANLHNSMSEEADAGKQNYSKILDRLIAIKLVKQEALNIGFDETPEVKSQVENYALTTMIQHLLAAQIQDVSVSKEDVDALYREMALEAKLSTYRFKDRADAEALLEGYQGGVNFRKLADDLVAVGKAEGGEDEEYLKLVDMLPAVSMAVFNMEKGAVSEIFTAENGFLVFRLEDRRVYEDDAIRQDAEMTLWQKEARKVQLAYLKSLEEKYVTLDEEVLAALDFAKISKADPQAKGADIFARLKEDTRPLATITDGRQTLTITVSEVARKLEGTLYHGSDRAIDIDKMEKQKLNILTNRLVAITGRLEAQSRGIDRSEAFLKDVDAFEERLLFDTFMAKAVIPGLTIKEDDARKYYYTNVEDYATPLMLRMKSLVFTNKASAQEAFGKLKAGSDFKWVSANTAGHATADNTSVLALGGSLLSLTALPKDLQDQLRQARQGDLFLYEGPGPLYYTLLIEEAYPPVAKPYEEVRQEIGRILYAEKINESLEGWVNKLKAAYETKNYLVPELL